MKKKSLSRVKVIALYAVMIPLSMFFVFTDILNNRFWLAPVSLIIFFVLTFSIKCEKCNADIMEVARNKAGVPLGGGPPIFSGKCPKCGQERY